MFACGQKCLRTLRATSLFLLLAACTSEPDQPIKVSLHIWSGYEPTFLAAREGWMNPKQVSVVEAHTAAESIDLLKSKQVDAAGLTFDEVLRARAEGVPLSVVLVCDISAGADVVLARPPIKTVAELKGKRIAVEQGALGALMLYKTLETANLTPADVIQVNIAPADQMAAWNANQVDAVVSYEPVSMDVEKTGANRLLDSRKLPDTIFDVLVVRQEVLQSRPEAVKDLVKAHLQALEFFHTNPQDAAYRMSEHLQLPPKEVLASFKGLTLPDLSNNQRLLAGPQAALLGSADSVSSILIAAGLLQQPDHKEKLVDAAYLP